jgi:adenylate kinase family enzyme
LQNRECDFAGEQIVGYENAIQKLYENSKILAWEDMPAAGVVLQQRKVTIIIGAPASGKSSIANKIAQAKNALIVDSDEAKKVLPEYENGVGAHAVHEESSILAGEVLVKALQNQDNIVYPRVGSNADEIDQYITKFQELGYDVDLVAVNVAPDEAYRRMIQRFINTGRLINPEYFESIGLKPMQTLNILKERVGRYAEIDNSQAIDEPKTIIQASRENPLEGVELRLRGGRETPNRLRDTATRSTVEATAAGEQRLIPGVSPITQKQRIETQIEQPLKGESAALDIGLFDEGAARQMDLTDLIPVGQQIDTETGERVLVQKTRQQIFDDIDADQKVIERFEECV